MAGVPMSPNVMGALQKQLATASPAANPRTPNNRKSPKEEFLERLNSIKALLKYIDEQDLSQDPIYGMILSRFKDAVIQMQLSADPSFVLQSLTSAFGVQGAPMGGGMPGAPGAPPMPGPAAVPPMPGQPPQAPMGNSPQNPLG